jgi:hypothetical protein
MTERTHVSLWLEAAAKHLIEDAIGGCQDVTAHFVGANEKNVIIVIERTPVCLARGRLGLIADGIGVHTDDSFTAKVGAPLAFEAASAYENRSSLVEQLFRFLAKELEGQAVIDLHMEGMDGEHNVSFETTVYSDDRVSFTTGATT